MIRVRRRQRQHQGRGMGGKSEQLRKLLGDGETKQQESLREVQAKFAWLEGSAVKDAKGHRPDHQDYDPRTVSVPQQIFQKLSDSQKQYWTVKRFYRDVILFFKVGKFYELYEDDAQIGHDVLQWRMTITGVGHCRQVGCPESGIDEAVARLTAAGFKVGRMEQMETALEAKAARGPKATIRRELTRVHTPATATGAVGTDAVHLLALCESPEDDLGHSSAMGLTSQSDRVQFGIAFLDAAAGRFYIGSASDDAGRANLGAILMQVAPREILVARGQLSQATLRALASPPSPTQLSPVNLGSEFPDPTLFAGDPKALQGKLGGLQLAPGLSSSAAPEALAALAALKSHLARMHAEGELATKAQAVVPYEMYASALRMDGPTLGNLELLAGADGGVEGSLLGRLDTCASPGGRRLLRRWLCRPLRSIPDIEARLDAVETLAAQPEVVGELRAGMKALGDLERCLGRVRNAVQAPSAGLPNWALEQMQRRRLSALASAVTAVKGAVEVLAMLQPDAQASALLAQAASHAGVRNQGAWTTLQDIQDSLVYGATAASGTSKGSKKERAQASAAPTLSQALLASAVDLTQEDEEQAHRQAEVTATTELIDSFQQHANIWDAIEEAVSTVDVLMGFAAFPTTADGPTCRPVLVPATGAEAVLHLEQLWHPCAVAGAGGAIVPNDLLLGGRGGDAQHHPRSLLLTGPNMGGKSTLLRATCAAVILAQMGCYVPAAAARLCPADRIFTRLGAQDRIMSGESTFLVECNEAAAVLRHATPDSLVVLDELGRGTSTFDGYAIAHAVLGHLSSRIDCRLLFATHYHPLTGEFEGDPRVALGHMAALVGPAQGQDSSAGSADGITFLYQMRSGACPRSYGLEVARLAGIPSPVVDMATKVGFQLEHRLQGIFTSATGRAGGTLTDQEAGTLQALRHALSPTISNSNLIQAWKSLQSAAVAS
ncbi:hypothetical protein WJX73_008383 [Symbiochloris irregularis]|uniref:DNA mismatch repair proteins mutS family domain-containing protein n=1 Tax=Symbiochloris irregularis TaxID=706552 RepID=A0AAW1PW37_9CHLO